MNYQYTQNVRDLLDTARYTQKHLIFSQENIFKNMFNIFNLFIIIIIQYFLPP